MKKLVLTLLLSGGLAQAQQLSPVYQQYLQAAAKVNSADEFAENLRLVTNNLGSAYNTAETASKAYVCAEYVKAYLGLHPEMADKRVDTGNFSGTFKEQQAACEGQFRTAMTKLPNEENAARALADISTGRLFTEAGDKDGSNKAKVQEIVDDFYDGGIANKFIESAVQLEILLNAYPAKLNQRLELGSKPIGTGSDVLETSQDAVKQFTAVITKAGKENAEQAQAEEDARVSAKAAEIVRLYQDMLDAVQNAQIALSKKDYSRAAEGYDFAASGLSRFQLTEQSLLALNINKQVTVGGKTMSFNEMVRAMAALAKSSGEKANPLHDKATEEIRAKIANWNKEINATFKGDRLKVFKLVNGYMLEPINDRSFLNNPKAELADYAKSSTWTFDFFQSGLPIEPTFSCIAKYTFKGDQLVNTQIYPDKPFRESIQICQQRFTVK